MEHQSTNLSPIVSKIMADKRAARRVRSTFSASLHKDGLFFAHCVIVDVSETGMKLRLDEKIDLPDDFEVRTPAMTDVLPVNKAWHRGLEFGVRYMPEEEQPPAEVTG